MQKNYYEILGVSRTATKEEIKIAYRNKMKELHPDLHPNEKTLEDEAKKVNEAYEVLYNDIKRRNYDLGINQTNTYPNSQTKDIFSGIINQFMHDLQTDYNTIFHQDLIKEFDDFMEYLNKMDEKFKEFNLTSENMKKRLKDQRGKLTIEEINNYKNNIEKQLEELKRNAHYYDMFMKDYNMIKTLVLNQELPFDDEKFMNYTNPKNRGKKPKEFYEQASKELFDLRTEVYQTHNSRISNIMKELTSLNLHNYIYIFIKRKALTSTLDLKLIDLKELEEYIATYKQLEVMLKSTNMSLDDILKKLKRTKETLSLEELKIIIRNVEEMKQNDLLAKWKLNNAIINDFREENTNKI